MAFIDKIINDINAINVSKGYKYKANANDAAIDALVDKVLDDTGKWAEKHFTTTAKQHADFVVQVMLGQVSSGVYDAMTHPDPAQRGWFELSKNKTFEIDAGAKPRTQPYTISSGAMGTFWEDAVMGWERNAVPNPDVGVDVESLVKEVEGTLTAHEGSELQSISRIEAKVSSSDRLTVASPTTRQYANISSQDLQKLGDKYKPAVNETILRLVAVVKIITKMLNLFLIETEKDRTRSNGEYLRFRYVAAVIYSKLDVKRLIKGFMGRQPGGYPGYDPKANLFTANVAPIDITKKEVGKNLHDYAAAEITIGLNITQIKGTTTNPSIYLDHYAMFDDKSDNELLTPKAATFFKMLRQMEINLGAVSINPSAAQWRADQAGYNTARLRARSTRLSRLRQSVR